MLLPSFAVLFLSSLSPAFAQDSVDVSVTTPEERTKKDVVVKLQRNGVIYVDKRMVVEEDLSAVFGQVRKGERVVVVPEQQVPWDKVNKVLDLARIAGVTTISLEVKSNQQQNFQALLAAEGGATKVENLGTISEEKLEELKPARWKFPQNPYANTDYTAYTLEWGETKIGLGSISIGALPRVQVGVYPVPLALGAYNGSLKLNMMREGPLDIALLGRVWVLPVAQLLKDYDVISEEDFPGTASLSYVGLGLRNSLRLAEPWSLHTGFAYTRVGLDGKVDIGNVPTMVVPIPATDGGIAFGDESSLAGHLAGEVLSFDGATDFRFNRRDSVILLGGMALFAEASVGLEADVLDDQAALPGATSLNVAQGGWLDPGLTYAVALAYQASWHHLEVRLGIGTSAIPYSWMLGTFDLSYRFGGETRRTEFRIKKGYRQNVQDIEEGDAGDKGGGG